MRDLVIAPLLKCQDRWPDIESTISAIPAVNAFAPRGWDAEVFDCDFNQMHKMPGHDTDRALSLWDIDPAVVEKRKIQTGEHCFGCTASAGSSCGGALL